MAPGAFFLSWAHIRKRFRMDEHNLQETGFDICPDFTIANAL